LGSLRTLLKRPGKVLEESTQTDEEFLYQQKEIIYKLNHISDDIHWIGFRTIGLKSNLFFFIFLISAVIISFCAGVLASEQVLFVVNFFAIIVDVVLLTSLVLDTKRCFKSIFRYIKNIECQIEELKQHRVSVLGIEEILTRLTGIFLFKTLFKIINNEHLPKSFR
jgi:hypothetical protein